MKDIEEYLQNKIDSLSVSGIGGNSGAVMLKFDKSMNTLESYVSIATLSVLQSIRRDSSRVEAKLTNASSKIGREILFRITGNRDHKFKDNIAIGDIMLEALLQTGYIVIYRDSSYSKDSNRAPYILSITEKWSDLNPDYLIPTKDFLNGTQFTPPEPVAKSQLKRNKLTKEEWNVVKDSQHIEAVNKLQQVAFKMNKRVLDTVSANKHLFISENLPKIPSKGNKRLMNSAYAEMRMAKNQNKDAEIIKRLSADYAKKANEWNKKLVALKERSKKVSFDIMLKKAHLLRDEPIFYQTIEVDYRGRIYYDESFLNYQGKDEARSMFLFERGVVMNDVGRKYLAVHTASSYNQSYEIDKIPSYFKQDYKKFLKGEGLTSISVDKLTIEDRVAWTENNLDLILQYAKNNTLLMEAEKPVAFLACCYEWEEYLIDPTTHVTYLPIQIDGSNNGWQHLGAMSKDPMTGGLVGLIPSLIQKDFYVQTAKSLMGLMPEWFKTKAMPMKHIRKGISKRGSMTRAYSAGENTMSNNMYEDCYQEKFTEKYGITVKDCNNLAHNLIIAINQVCPGPLKTMAFMQKLAAFEIGTWKMYKDDKLANDEYKRLKKKKRELIGNKEKTKKELKELSDTVNTLTQFESRLVEGNGKDHLEWTTPSGFHVIYKVFIQYSTSAKGSIKGVGRIHHRGLMDTHIPDVRGYMSGIAPNFVHSMDAAHMAITISNWNHDFAAVHDAYATHAPLIEELLYTTKEVFIDLYDEDNFYDEIIDMLISDSSELTVEKPEIGDMNIEEVRKSEYFFA